jgi:hypothetical protein
MAINVRNVDREVFFAPSTLKDILKSFINDY